MKKALSIIASCFLLVFCFTLVSCGAPKVSGTYKLYQVITIEDGNMTVEDALDGEPENNEDTRTYKDYMTLKFNKDGTVSTKFFALESTATWQLEGSTLTVTSQPEEEGEAPTVSTAYVNGSYVYYTMVQNSTRTVVLVLKKEPFKISSLFKKGETVQTSTVETASEE